MKASLDQGDIAVAFMDYADDIYNYVYFRLRNSKERAEDLTQEVFLRACKNMNSFDSSKASLKTWLYAIAKNLVIDAYKQHKPTLSLDAVAHSDFLADAKCDDPILVEQVVKSLNELSPIERELITLRYINEYELTEIAQIVDSNYSATKVAVNRALKKLKLIVNKK